MPQLLGWQRLLLAAVLGLFAPANPAPAAAALLLFLFATGVLPPDASKIEHSTAEDFSPGSRLNAPPLFPAAHSSAPSAGDPVLRGSGPVALHPATRAASFIAAFLLGAGLAALEAPRAMPPEGEGWWTPYRKVLVTGTVEESVTRPGKSLRIILRDVQVTLPQPPGKKSGSPSESRDVSATDPLFAFAQTPTQFRLDGRLVWTWQYAAFRPHPGERVGVRLRVKPVHGFANPGTWNSEEYWARRDVLYRGYTRGADAEVTNVRGPSGIIARLFHAAHTARDELRLRLQPRLTEPDGGIGQDGGLLMALLFGDRYWLRGDTMSLVARAALAHSLALSGLHLGFMAALGWGLAWLAGQLRPSIYLRLPRPKLAVLCGTPLILLYVWLGGASPSLVRAALMFAFWGLLLLRGRERVLIDGLFAAVGLMLLVSPDAVHNLSLQLSVSAVASIAVLLPLLRPRVLAALDRLPGMGRRALARPVHGAATLLLVSLAVQIGALPVLVWTFGELPLNILPNVLWLPVLGFAVLPLGLCGLLCAALSLPPELTALPLSGALSILDGLLSALTRLDAAGLLPAPAMLRPAWPAWIGYGAALLTLAGFRRELFSRRQGILLLLALLLLVSPSLKAFFEEARNGVRLTALDVGQGQALVVETPSGRRGLIDGGGFFSLNFDVGDAIVAPALTVNRPPRLRAVAVTHPDLDHLRGTLYPLERFHVEEFIGNGQQPGGIDAKRLPEALARSSAAPRIFRAGDILDLGDGVRLECLHPDADFALSGDNDASLVFRLTWRGRGLALLCGDIEKPGLRRLLAGYPEADLSDNARTQPALPVSEDMPAASPAGQADDTVSGNAPKTASVPGGPVETLRPGTAAPRPDKRLTADILILPHHGAASSRMPELYDRVRPRTALASCGFLNYWKFPSESVAQALKERGIRLMTTAESGAVTFHWQNPETPPSTSTARNN